MKKTLKGFTLIEMLIVIVIIGILAAVLIPKIGGAREKANDVAIKANVRSLAQGVLQMQLANATDIPTDFTGLNDAAKAQTYNYNLITQDTDKYTFIYNNGKFVVCGKLSDANAGGNSSAAATGVDWQEETSGQRYCYKG